MSYASLVKTLPETLGSSTSLAVLGSLGIHGFLWAVLPVLPLDSKSVEDQSQRTVGLVQLTPDEQSRLPQTSTPEATLPSYATQPSVLPPLPPPPAFNLVPPTTQPILPPLPPPSSFNFVPPANQPIVLPPSPPRVSFKIVPPSETSISKYSFRASLPPQNQTFLVPPPPNQNNQSTPRFSSSQPPALTPNQTYRSTERLPSPPRGWRQPPISGLPSTNGLTPQRFEPGNIPASPIAPANTNPQNTNQPQNQEVARANVKTPSAALPGSGKLSDRAKQELLARRQELREQLARSRGGATSQPITRATPDTRSPVTSAQTGNNSERSREEGVAALQQKLRQQSASNPVASTSETTTEKIAQLRALSERQNRVQQEHPKVETKRPIRQKLKTCQKQLDGSFAYLGAVVNPQGKIVSGPDLISKTGAADFARAKAHVSSYPFQATSGTTNYNFAIEFKYDSNCPAATPEPSPANPQTQQSKS